MMKPWFKTLLLTSAMAMVMVALLLVPLAPALAQGDGEETADPLGGATVFAALDDRTSVNLLLDWTPNTNHLGFYVAQALGYYDEANLDVTIQQPTDLMVEAVIASGAAEFGVSYQEVATFAIAEGAPIVSLAAIIQHNTSGFTTLHDQVAIETPADMVGLRYGGFGQPDLELAMLDTLLECDGAQAGAISYVDVGYADMFELMERDRIDLAWIYYAWTGIEAEQRGFDLDTIMLHDYFDCVPDYYTPILVTSEDVIAEEPDVVAAFVQATARGFAYAIENPDTAADILLEAAPELDADLVRESAAWLAGEFQADAPRWGEQSLDVWQGLADFLTENEILAEEIDMEGVFTNDYLPGLVAAE